MSASSRAARALPLLRSGLSRGADGAVNRCCGASLPFSRPARGSHQYPSRGPATRRSWAAGGGVRWYSADGSGSGSGSGSSVSGESGAASESGESVASSATSVSSRVPRFAFAFDIDGVLLHSSEPIPGATETLRYLQQHRIPFILLTNGGGKTEADRVADLSSKLGVELDVSNFVQSHTPYQRLVNPDVDLGYPKLESYLKRSIGSPRLSRDSTILVLGSDASKARHIARGYGFESVVTPADILRANPEIFPFDPLTEFYDKQEVLPLPKPIYSPKTNPDVKLEDCLKIDAIMTFNDPRDWAVDLQLIADLVLSHRGYLGTYSPKNGDLAAPRYLQWQSDGQPAVIFSNADLLWSTGYHLSRLGQGAFRSAVTRLFARLVANAGRPIVRMNHFTFGKPQLPTYWHAWDVLQRYYRQLLGEEGGDGAPGGDESGSGSGSGSEGVLRRVHMVGDNPESDIRGAHAWNRFHASRTKHDPAAEPVAGWDAYLVRTGVWDEDKVPLEQLGEASRPHHVTDDVRAAVNLALEKEGWPGRVE